MYVSDERAVVMKVGEAELEEEGLGREGSNVDACCWGAGEAA